MALSLATDQDLSALAAIRSTERVWRYAASLARSAAKCRSAYYQLGCQERPD
jgi:hypothetical protein